MPQTTEDAALGQFIASFIVTGDEDVAKEEAILNRRLFPVRVETEIVIGVLEGWFTVNSM